MQSSSSSASAASSSGAASPSAAAAAAAGSSFVVASGLAFRTLSFTNHAGQRMVGTLEVNSTNAQWLDEEQEPQPQTSKRRRCAVLCHGMLSHRSEFFLPELSGALLLQQQHSSRSTGSGEASGNRSNIVDGVFRFDYGMQPVGESEGAFEYGGYQRLVEETQAAIETIEARGWTVTLLVGHSMGANAVLLHTAAAAAAAMSAADSPSQRFTTVPRVVSISPRFDMAVDARFGKEDLLKLLKDGVMIMRARGHQIPISLETYRQRLQLDTRVIRQIALRNAKAKGKGGKDKGKGKPNGGGIVHTLLIHGAEDEVIPVRDSYRAHHYMLSGRDIGAVASANEKLDPQAARSTCVLQGGLLAPSASASALGVGSFKPALSARLPHIFVPLPGADHCFKSAPVRHTLIQTICLWVSEHAKLEQQAAARSASAAAAVSSAADDADDDDDVGGGGLEDFFTNREYVLQHSQYERCVVRTWALQNNTTDADLTGQVLWPGSEMLAYCLLAPFEAIRRAVPQLDEVMRPNGFFAMQEAHRARQHSCLCNNDNEQRYRVAAAGTKASNDAPSTCSFCSHGAASSAVGIAGGLPPYTLGCHLLHGRRVLELGSGYGLLGLLLAHFARSVTLTDHNDEVLQLLRRNVQLAEEGRNENNAGSATAAAATASSSAAGSSDGLILRRLQAALHVEKLAWGPEVDLPPFPGAATDAGDDGLPDVLIGGDIVYDGSVVPLLFSLVARYLERARPHALFLCSYKTRWLVVDREMDAALLRHGLRSLRVPLEAFMSAEKMAEKDGQRFKHGNMLIIWKPDGAAELTDSSPAAKL